MTSSTISLTPVSAQREQWRRLQRQLWRNPLVVIGFIVILTWILVALFAARFAPFEPLAQNVNIRLQPPGEVHRAGTDELGRDVASRIYHGGRITIPAGIAVIIVGSVVGTLFGAVAGYLGGWWDDILMRVTELFMAFPTIILAMAVTAALGPDIKNAILALVVVWWPSYARLIRALVQAEKNKEYVEAAHSMGASGFYILFRNILPNALAPIFVLMTLDLGNAILTFAGLSFLGLGAEPTSPEWGRMVSIGIDYFDQWWMWLFPGLAIATLVMAFNFIGDGLRDILDPRLR